jgi:site-specific recombinase XerC
MSLVSLGKSQYTLKYSDTFHSKVENYLQLFQKLFYAGYDSVYLSSQYFKDLSHMTINTRLNSKSLVSKNHTHTHIHTYTHANVHVHTFTHNWS